MVAPIFIQLFFIEKDFSASSSVSFCSRLLIFVLLEQLSILKAFDRTTAFSLTFLPFSCLLVRLCIQHL